MNGKSQNHRPADGFSLIEVLAGMALIALLTSASFGVKAGLDRRVSVLRAQGELSVIQQALEWFKNDYGDYPQTGTHPSLTLGRDTPPSLETAEVKLLNALCGRLGPTLRPVKRSIRLELHKLTLIPGAVLPGDATSGEVANALLDPWGRPYVYRYRSSPSDPWNAPIYLLYSLGPDGEELPPVKGVVDESASANLDNIPANGPAL